MLVGAFAAVVILAAPGLLLVYLGVIDSSGAGDRVPAGVVTAPYYPGGLWAVGTDVVVAAVVVTVVAATLQRSLAARTGFHLERRTALAVVALTSWAPFLGVHPLRLSGPTSFVLATVAVRFAARSEETDERWPVRPLAVLAAVAAAAVGLYVAFHPVRLASGGGVAMLGTPERPHQLVEVRNAGLAGVTLLSLSVPVDVGEPTVPGLRPLAGTRLPGRSTLWLTLRRPGCPPNVLTLRYRVFGRTLSEPLVLRQSCTTS